MARAASWLALSLLLVLASFGSVDGGLAEQVAKASLKSHGETGATEATDEDAGSEEEVDDEEELEHEEGGHDLDDDDDDHEDEMLKDDALEHEDDDDTAADEERDEEGPESPQDFIDEADLDKDGKISLMELHHAMDGEQGSEDNATSKADDPLISELTLMHAAADRNKDGLLDVEELPALLQHLDEDHMEGDDTEQDEEEEEDDAGKEENNNEVGEEDEAEDRDMEEDEKENEREMEEDDEKAEEKEEEENQEDK